MVGGTGRLVPCRRHRRRRPGLGREFLKISTFYFSWSKNLGGAMRWCRAGKGEWGSPQLGFCGRFMLTRFKPTGYDCKVIS